jgi:cellulose biosynthesis protein BcsQ
VPAILYDAKSRGAEAYLALAREVLVRGESAAAQSQEHHG